MEFRKASVEWVNSFDDGLTQAKEQDKPILLDFFKDG